MYASPVERMAVRDGWLSDIWRSRVSSHAEGSNAAKSADAENLRVSLVILGFVALVFVVVQGHAACLANRR